MDRIRVLIAEDEDAVREALADLVGSDTAMDVVGKAADAEEAIQLARREHPDVALLDVKMPRGGGPRAAREIRKESPHTHVVALSAYEDRRTVLQMLRAGVVGYIVKGTSPEEILYSIRRTMRGQGSLSVEVTADVIHELATLLERSESLTRDLQDLNRTKSELIQILSHELFTPITTIKGFALTVADNGDRLSSDEIQELAVGVSRASDRIKRLVGNLAAAARLDREGVEVSTQPCPAAEVIQRAVSEFPGYLDRIAVPSPDGSGIRLWADREHAGRALVVLLENALSMSDERSPVEIGVDGGGDRVRISVSDRGPGIDPDKRDVIFEAFTQVDGSTTRTHEGLGVGLYLARRIMRAHGGSVSVAAREGGGSTFALSFSAVDEAGALG